MSSLHIRLAVPSDCPQILYFIQALAEYEKLSHEVHATVPQLEATLFGARPCATALLAFEEDTPVGFALFFQSYSTFLARPGIHLEDLFVEPAFRGRGYGKALLQALARYTTEKNFGRLEWNVLDWNQPAIDFYLSLDAIPMSEWTTFRLTGHALKSLAASHHSSTGKR